MKQFMAVFTGSNSGEKRNKWDSLDDKARKAKENEGKAAWGKWMEKNSSSIVYHGSPLGKTKRVSEQGIADIKNNLAVFIVVKAETHEAAAKMFLDHPHFTIFPGDAIEVMECVPIPN